MKLTSDRCVDCGRQTDYAGLRGGDWVPMCRRDCQDDFCNGSTKGRDDMNRTHKRLVQMACTEVHKWTDADGTWLVATARRAIEALEKIRAYEVNGVSNVAGFALDEIEDGRK